MFDTSVMEAFEAQAYSNPAPFRKTFGTKSTATAGNVVSVVAPPAVTQAVLDEEAKKYVARRALDVISEKKEALRMKFRIGYDYEIGLLRPKTVQEAAERLTKGEFTVKGADKKDPVKYPHGGLQDVFSWRTKETFEDKEGWEKAKADFKAFYNPLLDEIRVFYAERGLEAFRKIEAYAVD